MIRLTVIDMQKAFYNSIIRQAAAGGDPLYDRFHVIKLLGEQLDKTRKAESTRLQDRQRRFIKAQKYVLLSQRQDLTASVCNNVILLLSGNKRSKFFENWPGHLK